MTPALLKESFVIPGGSSPWKIERKSSSLSFFLWRKRDRRLVSLLYLMYQIDREKELLFVSLSLEKDRQEACVSALFDVSDR